MKNRMTDKSSWIFPSLTVLASLAILAACVMPGTVSPTGDPVEQAMQTLQAQATQEYYQTVVAQLTATAPVVENTPTINPTNINQIPTDVPTVAVTQVPATQPPVVIPTQSQPTAVPATPTKVPPTPTPLPCYQVQFVNDITIPDGTKIVAGNNFTKTWRLRTSGS